MFEATTDFKIGKLNSLVEQQIEITEENQQLNFYITGKSNNNSYSLNFISTISIDDMLKFNLNEHIDFIQYVDDGNVVFEKNGLYDLHTEIKMDIMRYLSKSFILMIYFKNHENEVGYLELDFSYKSCE